MKVTNVKPSMGYEDLQKLAKRQKWSIRALAALLVIICTGIAWLIAYKAAEGFWLKTIVISAVDVHVKRAQAAELTTEQYIKLVFGKEAPTALAVAKAESGLRCDAQNVNKGTNSLDLGVMQINSVHLKKGWKVADLLDCKSNIRYAKEIYDGSGWGAWSTCKNKKVICK